MMLKGSGKMGLSCFVPGLSGKAPSFLPLRMMFFVSFANLPLTYPLSFLHSHLYPEVIFLPNHKYHNNLGGVVCY